MMSLFLCIQTGVQTPRCLSAGFISSGSQSGGSFHPVSIASDADTACRHLHLHVISDDLVSSSLKTKKHYNSFNPNLGFFVPLDEADDVSLVRDECPSVRSGCASVESNVDTSLGNLARASTGTLLLRVSHVQRIEQIPRGS